MMNASRIAVSLAVGGVLMGCVAPAGQHKHQDVIGAVQTAGKQLASEESLPGTTPHELIGTDAPAAKIGSFETRIPLGYQLPPLAGVVQRHDVSSGEDLLTISRDMGIGFRALRDANPRIDEWEPREGTELVVPTRWILPRGAHRGLVINVAELRMFMFPEHTTPGQEVPVLTWPVGAGDSLWQTPIEPFTVTSKDTNPTWVVPDSIYRKMQEPRRVVPPGPDNPLGKHRIRLSLDTYLIHGTNDPWTVGRLTTHGCVRLYPEDVEYLYTLVHRGTPGEFVYQPVKVGEDDGRVFVEVHRDIYQRYDDLMIHARTVVSRAGLGARIDYARLEAAVEARLGMPIDITKQAGEPAGALPEKQAAQSY